MLPSISVIVPVYNREKLVIRCLDSIINQSLLPYELIVVDNNSTDSSFKVISQWIEQNNTSKIKFKLISEIKPGACAARQKGLENASGDFIIFFDSDDAMRPELIETAARAIENNPDCDIVCWKCLIHLLDGSERIPPFMLSDFLESHLIHTLLRPQGYMVRKKFLTDARGWTKDITVWNDYELGLRLLLQNPVIIPVNKVLADIYSQADSITGLSFSSKAGLWEKTLSLMEKETNVSTYPKKERITRILNYRRAILASIYDREGNKTSSQRLLSETLKDKSFFEKFLLKFSYNFTRMGLRGAWRIVRYAYR